MEIVGPGFGGVVQHTIRCTSEFRRISPGLNLELFNALRAHHSHGGIVAALTHRLAAIQKHAVSESLTAGNSWRAARGIRVARDARICPGCQKGEGDVAPQTSIEE